ncbi:Ty3-gypsy retrotransposon protein [Abeliophyllum distichum]|uniref:Ty3-gypsy retrotransposon protein n=1 Tax=Abeliophyllum distichum TaxID=126358 RepID=A0ABD1Q1R0_9LAMI
MAEDERMEATSVCFEGEALAWFHWEKKRRKLTNWDGLKVMMLERFRPSQEGSMEEKFFGPPAREFTQLNPRSLTILNPNPISAFPYSNSPTTSKPGGQRFLPTGKASNPPFKRLSEAELQLKKEKGLCFRCDEKYTVGHRCKNKELQVLLVQEGDEWEVEEGIEGEASTEEGNEVGEVVELSLNSVVGLTPPRTMKVKGKIAAQEVVILIDCGASHNFISTELVQKLGLPRTATNGYGVIMGTRIGSAGRRCVQRCSAGNATHED